jgi:hypothetical protein
MNDDQPPKQQPIAPAADASIDDATLEPDAATGGSETRSERRTLQRLSEILRFNDFMTVMMVIATAFSAFATWRTAQVTNLLFAIAERPYIGVQEVAIDGVDADFARVVVDCRNYGEVSANGGVARVVVMVDGKSPPDSNPVAETETVGIVSPTVPHRIFRYVPKGLYDQVRAGRSRMIVRVLFNYRGPDARQFCYSKLLTYDRRSGDFIPNGGTDQCGGLVY